MAEQKQNLVYVGTYTTKGAEGIYVYRFDPSSAALSLLSVASSIENPSFLALHPDGSHLYAVNEVGEYAGQPGGAVSAFSIDPQTGALTLLNQQPSHGAAPCHVTVDRTGRFVLVANYVTGSAAMFPIQDHGRLGEASDVVQHQGSSVSPRRQGGPHAHSVTLDPANRYAFIADLGIDKIMVYQLDLTQGKLRPHDEPWVQIHAGAGPRHFAFHPSGRYAYIINELDSTLIAFAYDAVRGTLRELQTVSTLPDGFEGVNYCADVHVSRSGEFLYGSNRGHDSIAIFAIDQGTGTLTCIGHQPTQGKAPRNFGLDPAGAFLLAANQDSDTIVAFRVDQQTGQLTPTGHVTQVPAPVCIKWL